MSQGKLRTKSKDTTLSAPVGTHQDFVGDTPTTQLLRFTEHKHLQTPGQVYLNSMPPTESEAISFTNTYK
ncbi:hypothetical protein Trydic_g23933 [Trypoxylus dichotomus]